MKVRFIILLAVISSCTIDRKPAFSEIGGENYTIQVMSLPAGGDSGASGYKVRVFPAQKVLDEQGGKLRQQLLNQTDSCFYITQGSDQIKPQLVQPIIQELANCYEFMLVFEGVSAFSDKELSLVFDDLHITREKYRIKLTRKL